MNSGKSEEYEGEGKYDDLLIMKDASYRYVEPTFCKMLVGKLLRGKPGRWKKAGEWPKKLGLFLWLFENKIKTNRVNE